MSRSPCGTSRSSSSLRRPWSRRARIAPRRWMPTMASRSGPSPAAFFSTISWAMRTSVRRMSSPSRTTFSSANLPPFSASRDRVKGTRRKVAAPPAAPVARAARPGSDPRPLARLEPLHLRLALLREGHVDRVEVARDDGPLEHRARFVADLAAAVAGRDVREREQPDLGLARDPGRLARGAVAGLERALALLLGERRLVDEQVGAMGGDAHHVARRRVARDDDPPPRPLGPDDLLGPHAVDDLAALQAPEVRAERDAELDGELVVEPARACVLDDRVAEGLHPVADVERADLVAVVDDRLARLELDDVERVAEAAVDDPHRAHELDRPGRPVDGEGRVAVAQVEGLQHAGQAEPVV